jgi:AraC family transcriptional regulator of adaptative response/methylated-DNA-[protein]-cysteine methyltransferase
MSPLLPTTRWHGTTKQIGFLPTAAPTARAAFGSPILAASAGAPKAARAVGAAVGKNPICFVVPCHRVIGKSGELTGYHWGLTRKRAMLGWEAGMAAA